MIKFFRKIRQNLLKEGKTARYFKYAIGEIILVVIGILIALQINNWNLQRIEQHKENIYLANIKRDLHNQLSIINIQLEYEQKYLDNSQPILDYYYKHNKIILDARFIQNLSTLTERKTFVSNDTTYTDLISTGNIDIIKDIKFKNKLIEYYQDLERFEIIIQNNNIYLNDQIYVSGVINLLYLNDSNEPLSIELIEVSNQILEKEENVLLLINLVNHRKDLAKGHFSIMHESKSKTQQLLNFMDSKP